jgi:hypothetical protein
VGITRLVNDPEVRGVDFDLFEVQIQDPIQAKMLDP